MSNNKLISYFVNLSLLGFSIMVQASSLTPFDAARKGDLNTLREYRFNNNDLFIPDQRGFIPYELAALHAKKTRDDNTNDHVELMLWLKEYKPEKHKYGKASISLIQAGLNALGYPSGPIDGILGDQTRETILIYQKANDLPKTGRPGAQWLGIFYSDIAKDIQFKLTQLGYNTQGTDGFIGKNTRKAISSYRKAQALNAPTYDHLDSLLVQSLTDRVNALEKKVREKQAQQKITEAKETISFLQASLKSQGYRVGKIDGEMGSKTSNALKKFQKKNGLEVTGKISKESLSAIKPIFIKTIQKKLNAMGYNTGIPDGMFGKGTQQGLKEFSKAYSLNSSKFDANIIENINNSYSQFKLEKKVAAKKATQKKKAKQAAAKKKSSTPKKTVKKKKIVKKPKKSKRIISIKGNKSSGRMSFNKRGGRVVGCKIAGRKIPIEWCEPFYPLPKNNRCEVTFKASGREVINLWCK